MDYCILKTVPGEAPLPNFLEISRVPLQPGKNCILAAFQIGIQQDMKDLDPDLSVGVFKGEISKLYPRHFVYQCPSFAGDSGGAVVLRDGKLLESTKKQLSKPVSEYSMGKIWTPTLAWNLWRPLSMSLLGLFLVGRSAFSFLQSPSMNNMHVKSYTSTRSCWMNCCPSEVRSRWATQQKLPQEPSNGGQRLLQSCVSGSNNARSNIQAVKRIERTPSQLTRRRGSRQALGEPFWRTSAERKTVGRRSRIWKAKRVEEARSGTRQACSLKPRPVLSFPPCQAPHTYAIVFCKGQFVKFVLNPT